MPPMKPISPALLVTTFAFSLGAIALFAQQNATLISIKLFGLTLLNLPLGLVLTFSTIAGLLLALLLQTWWITGHRR